MPDSGLNTSSISGTLDPGKKCVLQGLQMFFAFKKINKCMYVCIYAAQIYLEILETVKV